MAENVNHPKHYNQHPAGIECIDIIRHYTCDIANAIKYLWRAGLKPEMGKEDAEKEIEDLKKALWYIEDYEEQVLPDYDTISNDAEINRLFKELTGYTIEEVTEPYCDDISTAMKCLLLVGLIDTHNRVNFHYLSRADLSDAAFSIKRRILDIETSLLDKEMQKVGDAINGNAIDGEDYVTKPGCNRETEPEHYDPMNMIVASGRVYSLTNKIRKRDNGSLFTPCENCDLYDVCYGGFHLSNKNENLECFQLCHLHLADTDEYYEEVGIAKYSPSFGTVEVVDEHKEAMLELKRLEEEEDEYV